MGKETLQAHDQRTGRGVNLDPEYVIINRADPLARVLAIGALGLGLIGSGVAIHSELRTVESQDTERIEVLEEHLRLNDVGDRQNENALRASYGIEPVTNWDQYWRERKIWAEKMDEPLTPSEIQLIPAEKIAGN